MNESDVEHGEALRSTGFWGRQGAGAIILAKSTGKLLIPFRSAHVEQPNTWGVWGGAIDSGEDPKEAAKREIKEEVGYRGLDILMIPMYIFHDQKSGFKYYNFLAVVDDEFTPNLNWETEKFKWVELDEVSHLSPLHFGLKALLRHSGPTIQKVVEKVKGSTMLKESDGDPRVIVRPDIKKGDSVLIQQGFGPYGGKRGKVVDIVKMIRSQVPNTAMFAKGISVPPQAVIQIPEIEMDIQIPISKLSKI